ncbi:MAG TPA: hypothetical protein VK723_03405 [Thermoplasmata archaeon]|nr:hypothetical protein [Thermoplasmata archaeon]
MAWGGPVEPAARRPSWKKEIRKGPRPGDEPYGPASGMRDRVVAATFGTQVAFGVGFGILIIGATVFYAQYSGAVRWALGIVILSGTAYLLVRFVGSRARDPRPLEPARRVERRAAGGLRSLAKTLDRARDGLKFSQVVVAARMKDAFLEKVRVSRGLALEDIERIRSDPVGLMALVGDRELVVFLLESERNHRHWPALLQHLPTRHGFGGETERMLAKMEAWR